MAILAYNESKINTRTRNIAGFSLFFLCTLSLIVIDLATSGKGGIGNFIGICVFVAGSGVADTHVQGGMVGDLAFMRPEFIQSFFAGLAASGALTSGLRLITKAAFDKASNGLRNGTMLFLAISTFFELLCIFLYSFVFGKLPIVKYYRMNAAREGLKTVASDLAAAGVVQTVPVKKILLFQNHMSFEVQKSSKMYPLVLIAIYNVWNLISRYIPLIEFLKMESRKGLMIATLSRFLFIPAFYFTAKYGDEGWMIVLISFLGLTTGYLTVCVMTVAPKGCMGPEANALGNLLVLFLMGGMLLGAALDWLWLIGKGSF
ncbi:hypothetical protein OSB04_024343 [Centaurea solstitialis]|uniref:Equilibrative nucleoside transporter n=1 Tax=Centaurea solstitialis TaxID=347529 RepID=A0AA38SZA2_9ASTR|nr:hypothetical protein OSB04_024343 [Centaurea solstitialis]